MGNDAGRLRRPGLSVPAITSQGVVRLTDEPREVRKTAPMAVFSFLAITTEQWSASPARERRVGRAAPDEARDRRARMPVERAQLYGTDLIAWA